MGLSLLSSVTQRNDGMEVPSEKRKTTEQKLWEIASGIKKKKKRKSGGEGCKKKRNMDERCRLPAVSGGLSDCSALRRSNGRQEAEK